MIFTTTENIGTWTEAVSDVWFRKREAKMIKLFGKRRWGALPFVHQIFFIKAAGMFDLGFPIDIKKAYKYDSYDEDL